MFLIPKQLSPVKQTTLWWVTQSGRVSKMEHGVGPNPDVLVCFTRALLVNVKLLSLERSPMGRALASRHCGLDVIRGSDVACGLSLLLVLVTLASRVLFRVLRFSTLRKSWKKASGKKERNFELRMSTKKRKRKDFRVRAKLCPKLRCWVHFNYKFIGNCFFHSRCPLLVFFK